MRRVFRGSSRSCRRIATRAVAFEGEDVGADAVQEIAVVADDDDAAFEGEERFLEQAQRGEIEVVRRFVEDEDVAAALQDFREDHAAAFAAAELRDLGVDAVVGEKKPPQVGAQRDVLFAERTYSLPLADFLPDGLLVVEERAGFGRRN